MSRFIALITTKTHRLLRTRIAQLCVLRRDTVVSHISLLSIKLFLSAEELTSFTAQIHKFLPTLVANPLEDLVNSSREFRKSSSGFLEFLKRICVNPLEEFNETCPQITSFPIANHPILHSLFSYLLQGVPEHSISHPHFLPFPSSFNK